MGLSKKEEKEHARLLYVNDRVSFREIATRVKVSERTVSRWAREGNWDKLRKSLLATKENQLVAFYNQLEALNEEIEQREKKIPTNPEADIMSKITSNIYKLEGEMGLGEMVMTGKKFIGFLQDIDRNLAKTCAKYFGEFIDKTLKGKNCSPRRHWERWKSSRELFQNTEFKKMIITPEELKTGLYPEVIEEITRADGKEILLHIKSAEDFAKGFLFKYDLKALFGVEEDPPSVRDEGLKKVVKVMASYFLVRKSNPSVSLSLFREDWMIWIGTDKEPGYLYDIREGKINPE